MSNNRTLPRLPRAAASELTITNYGEIYLGRKRITVDVVFGSLLVLGAVMYVYLLELISVSQGAAGDVNVLLCLFVHAENKRLARVVQHPADLKQN